MIKNVLVLFLDIAYYNMLYNYICTMYTYNTMSAPFLGKVDHFVANFSYKILTYP